MSFSAHTHVSHLRHLAIVQALFLGAFFPLAVFIANFSKSVVAQLPDEPHVPTAGKRVFFTGHSFHMFVAPRVKELAASASIVDHRQMGTQGIGGSACYPALGLARRQKHSQALLSGNIDVFTMAAHIQLPDQGIENFTQLALEHNPCVRLLVQASWLPFDALAPKQRIGDNAERDKTDLVALRGATDRWRAQLEEQVDELNQRHGRTIAFVIPVGDAVLSCASKSPPAPFQAFQNLPNYSETRSAMAWGRCRLWLPIATLRPFIAATLKASR